MTQAKEGGASIRLLLVDDHQLVRDGLKARLGDLDDIVVLGEAANAEDALAAAERLQPDLALVDVGLPGMNGIELTSAFAASFPALRVLILSMYDSRGYVQSAMRAGARGYVLKDAPSAEIIAAIRAVAAGGVYLSSALTAALSGPPVESSLLTEREKEVLILIAQGASNKRVAQKLDVSVRTVETHRLNLRRKLGIETAAGLANYAIKRGWIEE
ncbi:MAG: response regulator transcription factor [Aromatoleum sp.]|jgi:DNA-binding NarL/FixJ family response regulator|uniref:response regulator transcription factor n=1 Tax=Aromatoleum sp. TaxID=2307007 RepID=UPI00289539BC|nr:response regulator transcription factor [Aromatoleum sp.]MDT3670239.1 response regulator transcription factor [Aromatoleum sp.]